MQIKQREMTGIYLNLRAYQMAALAPWRRSLHAMLRQQPLRTKTGHVGNINEEPMLPDLLTAASSDGYSDDAQLVSSHSFENREVAPALDATRGRGVAAAVDAHQP